MSIKMEEVREGVPVIGLVIIVTCRFCRRPFNCLSILLFIRIHRGIIIITLHYLANVYEELIKNTHLWWIMGMGLKELLMNLKGIKYNQVKVNRIRFTADFNTDLLDVKFVSVL